MNPDIKFTKLLFKFKSKKFEFLQFRRHNLNDLIWIEENLEKISDDKEFVYRHLHNQLHLPNINYSKFQEITEQEVKEIARRFISKERQLFRNFKETTDPEFYKNFRDSIRKYKEEEYKRFHNSIELIRKTLESFHAQYSDLITQRPLTYDILKEIIEFAQSVKEAPLPIVESMKPFMSQARSLAIMIEKMINPQIEMWQKWANENQRIFDNFRGFWKDIYDKYKIKEQEAIKILRKYKWFVTPSLPIAFVSEVVKIGKKRGNRRGEINNLFINYFCSKNFKELEALVNGWDSNDIFKPRMKILKDCVRGLKNARRGCNPSNFVLPALFAQIDGIQQEYMETHGCIKERKWKDAAGKEINWKDFYRNMTLKQDLYELANEIFLNILFQKSQRGKPLETPFTFNRHKIMHGEHIRYGRIDYTIRAFLILDFLASLK